MEWYRWKYELKCLQLENSGIKKPPQEVDDASDLSTVQ